MLVLQRGREAQAATHLTFQVAKRRTVRCRIAQGRQQLLGRGHSRPRPLDLIERGAIRRAERKLGTGHFRLLGRVPQFHPHPHVPVVRVGALVHHEDRKPVSAEPARLQLHAFVEHGRKGRSLDDALGGPHVPHKHVG